ncbi:MAG: hypothetical protein U9R54_01020 [Bacteroidota bacterium]|nr:hypothetical protein [Bacteroidota bacterium]
MKKLLLFSIISIFTINISLSQNITNKQFSLFNYELEISDEFRQETSILSSFINSIETYKNPGDDQLKAILIHNIYYSIKETLERKLEIAILPVNSFQNEINYNDYAYPKASIRKALRKGYSKFYFKVNVKIESLTEEKRESNPKLFEEINGSVTIPQVTIDITIFNKDGIIPVDKWHGKASANTPLPIDNYLFKGFDRSGENTNNKENLSSIKDKAINQLVQNFLNK